MIQWRVKGRSMEVLDETSGSWVHLCDAFGISSIEVDLLSGCHKAEIFVDSSRAGMNKLLIERNFLKKTRVIDRFYDLGLQLSDSDDDIPILQQILFESEQGAPLEYRHDRLGFATIDGNEVFLLDQPIGPMDPLKAGSHYAIPGLVTPRGTLDKWMALVEKEVLGRPELEMAVAIGAVAPVAHLLRTVGTITDLPVVALIGKSTSGKTTALRVAASLWALPVESIGVIDDLNATENAFFETIARNVGFPAFIDETSARPSWDFERMLYFLPKGRSKRRCNASGELRKASAFSAAAIFTGEHSLLQGVAEDSGKRARIVEFTDLKWTKNGEHAERITEGLLQSYGTAAPVLVQWLMNHRDELPALFKAERNLLLQRMGPKSSVEERATKINAMILIAAHALREALALELDVESIRLLMLRCSEEKPTCDKITGVYHSLLEKIAANGSKFTWPSKKATDHPAGKDVWGQFEYHRSIPCVWIGFDRFTALLGESGIRELREIAKPFCEKGWLVDFGGRHYYRAHKINGLEMKAVCLLFPEAYNLFDRIEALPAKATDAELARALRGESFVSSLFSEESDEEEFKKAAEESDRKMAICFAVPCHQGEALMMNGMLAEKLMLKDRVFVTVIGSKKLLLLSPGPVAEKSVKLTLKPWRENKLCANSRAVRGLLKLLNFNIPVGQALALTDINTGMNKGQPLAVIGADISNPIGMTKGPVTGWEFPPEDPKLKSQVQALLENNENDTD